MGARVDSESSGGLFFSPGEHQKPKPRCLLPTQVVEDNLLFGDVIYHSPEFGMLGLNAVKHGIIHSIRILPVQYPSIY